MSNEHAACGKVRAALAAFFEEDHALLQVVASERSISHKLAEHLQRQFPELKVDCEYNRHGNDVKRLQYPCNGRIQENDLEARTVFPDIIVHRRQVDESNLLVVEIKKANSRENIDCDAAKLKAFTRKEDDGGEYHYKIGLFLLFDAEGKRLADVRCFKDGEEVLNTMWANLRELGYGG